MSETKTNGQAAAIAPLAPSAQVGATGIMIRDFDTLARFTKMVEASGFAPKGMNAAAIGVAIQMGLEVGLSPMQALQSTAVINGRPSIYGDAAKALVEASGLMEQYQQWFEAGGKRLTTAGGIDRTPTAADLKLEDCTCYVLSKRKGREPMVTGFSVADARLAGLWGKSGPWTQYPARMLMFRARGFNLRDNFGDVLKGLRTVEEAEDQVVIDVPTPAGQLPAAGSRVDALAERLRSRGESGTLGGLDELPPSAPIGDQAADEAADKPGDDTVSETAPAVDAESDAAPTDEQPAEAAKKSSRGKKGSDLYGDAAAAGPYAK